MIEKLFIQVLNMSLTACVAIVAVLLVRIFLKKAPRAFSYALWAAVLFRLLCPFSFSSAVSLFGVAGIDRVEQGRMVYIPENIGSQPDPWVDLPVSAIEGTVNVALPQKSAADSQNPLESAMEAASRVWLCGVIVMPGYSSCSLYRLGRKLKGAVCLKRNIYSADDLAEPFVIGVFRPRIYLPSFLEEGEKEYILLHEQTHIKRRDPAFRAVSFLALCLHWFNPFVWIAYHISGRDMEMSCDEAVIKKLGDQVKKEYSASLLNIAAGRKVAGGVPLAFGAGDTKSRIKNVLHYKKPAFWGLAAAGLLCAAAAAALISNPTALRGDEVTREGDEEYLRYYGVLKEAEIEGTVRKMVTVPGIGDVELPEAEEVSPWFETEHFELETGDLVQINFLKDEEVLIEETYPARFSKRAQSVVAIMRSLTLEYEGEDHWLFAFPEGILPFTEVRSGDTQGWIHVTDDEELSRTKVHPGDTLEIVHEITYEKNGYFQPFEEKEAAQVADRETVAVVPILEVTDGEVPCVVIKLTTQQVKTVLENLGFGISFSWEAADGAVISEEVWQMQEAADNTSASAPADGTYKINVRTISRKERKIDEYAGENAEDFVFAEDCAFTVNYEMAGIRYEEVSFDVFADLIEECDPYLNKPCLLTFRAGEIVKADLCSAYVNNGISFREVTGNYELVESILEGGEEPLKGEYGRKETLKADISDHGGIETAEVYAGDQNDGNGGGYVIFRDFGGELIWIEQLFVSRSGWGNIYIGECDGIGYIMKLYIEDSDQYGEYAYEVFRVAADGGVSQIAGSSFEWGDIYDYDDELFRKWVSGMEYYLENSYLVLSTQDGEIRTEWISEREKYCYETLSLKNRMR